MRILQRESNVCLIHWWSILAELYPTDIDDILKLIRKDKLDITDEGTLEDFLGVSIDRKNDGIMHLTQLQLIDNILGYLNLSGER